MVEYVIINAQVLNNRQRYLAEARLAHPSPLENAIEIGREMFPDAFILVVSGEEAILDVCRPRLNGGSRLVKTDRPVEWGDFSHLFELPPEAGVLVLSPFDGVVSGQRIREVCKAHESSGRRLTLSVSRVEDNAHPSFNRIVPSGMAGQGVCSLEKNQEVSFDPKSYINEEIQDSFPPMSKIPGSQWLPELFRTDGAIAVGSADALHLVGQRDSDDVYLCHAEDDGESSVLAYQLPVFLFSKESCLGRS